MLGLHSSIAPVVKPARGSRFVGPVLISGSAAVLIVAGFAAGQIVRGPAADPCAVRGLDLSALAAHDRGMVARHTLACEDFEHGRITLHDYVRRVGVLETAWIAPPPPAIEWATSVRDVSTQYTTTSWSASKVLGPPDVYPSSGDNSQAWASLDADGRDEWIEVGYSHPMSISAVEIYETYNAGAVDRVELVGANGAHFQAYAGTPEVRGGAAYLRHIDVPCTDEPIVGVRVHLASTAVPGWNEIDAIGVVPCTTDGY